METKRKPKEISYKVYAMIDFDTNEIKYIGCTGLSLDSRLTSHLKNSWMLKGNRKKFEYLMNCLESGALPEMKLLFSFDNRKEALRREKRLIIFLSKLGYKLLNVQSV